MPRNSPRRPLSASLDVEVELGRRAAHPGDAHALVALAVDMIDEDGAEQFSVRGLAARAGVYANTVTHHLGGRPQVMSAALDYVVGEIPPPVGFGTVTESVIAHAENAWSVLAYHPGTLQVAALAPAAGPKMLRLRAQLIDVVGDYGLTLPASRQLVDGHLLALFGSALLALNGPVQESDETRPGTLARSSTGIQNQLPPEVRQLIAAYAESFTPPKI